MVFPGWTALASCSRVAVVEPGFTFATEPIQRVGVLVFLALYAPTTFLDGDGVGGASRDVTAGWAKSVVGGACPTDRASRAFVRTNVIRTRGTGRAKWYTLAILREILAGVRTYLTVHIRNPVQNLEYIALLHRRRRVAYVTLWVMVTPYNADAGVGHGRPCSIGLYTEYIALN